jgi:hypothetical protein
VDERLTDQTPARPLADEDVVQLSISRREREVLVTALRHLEATLGREEADELELVQALLARIEQ